ncbi:nuclease Le1 [Russula emetica]|nr:nuclease Le1 [Russula emetica]
MKATLYFALAVAFMAPRSVSAWGNLGHEIMGYLAMQFLDPSVLSTVQSMLGSTFNNSLGPAATWADQVRSQPGVAFSSPYHFIDAHDDPPTSCSADPVRDCGSAGCVVSAIQNYTTRLLDPNLDDTQHQQALLFITHFIGDIGQPLHTEALALGGNQIVAECDGNFTNLHAIWDFSMLTKTADALYNGSSQTYAFELANRITSGEYSSFSAGWVSDIDQAALNGTAVPLRWAQESDAYDCTVVFNYTTDQDLCNSSYYADAIPVIDLQLAKQGLRLATWLNAIFE